MNILRTLTAVLRAYSCETRPANGSLSKIFGPVALALVALAMAPSAFADFERIHEPLPDDPMGVSIYRLDNGLTVYLTENHQAPRFMVEIAVRAGSKHDPAETTGLAHYLEHLLFKGTTRMGVMDWAKEQPHIDRITALYEKHFRETNSEKRQEIWEEIVSESQQAGQFAIPNEMDRLYQGMGAEGLNAHTWHEETVYTVDLPANRLRHWAMIESERIRAPVFRLFQTELETVYEEFNRALDNKSRIISYAVEKQLYKEHPYGQQPTIGLPEHLKNPSLKNIAEFYETWYVPNNMAIIISGDIDKGETIELIDKKFSEWKAKDLPKLEEWEEPALDGRENVEVTYEGEEYALLAYRTVSHDHSDAEALMLLDMILDNASAGLINLNLNQQQKVRAAGTYPQQYNDHGAQYLWGIPKAGQTLQEVEQLLRDQVELVKKGEFEEWIIPAIIVDFQKNLKAGLEHNSSRVAMMRRAFVAFEEWERAIGQIERMEKLTKADVVRVANKYFGENYVAGHRKDAPHDVPQYEKPKLATVQIDASRVSEFGAEVLGIPADPIEPEYVEPGKDYQKKQYAPGVDLYYAKNPLNDLFTFSIMVDFGSHQDKKIGMAVSLIEKAGAGDLSAEELKKEWYKLGADFGMGAGENETVITLSGLDENFESSLKLLMDLLNAPHVEDNTLEELKAIVLKQREDAKKQGPAIAQALVSFNLYGKESPYLQMLNSEQVNALTEEELFSLIKGLLNFEHSIAYAGSLSPEHVAYILRKVHPVQEGLKDPPPYKLLKARRPEKSEILFFDKDLAQSTVQLGFPTIEYTPEITAEAQLFNSYFSGGMAGIVFQELREARALAYTAAAHYVRGYRKGDEDLMIGFIQTQADKTTEAVKAFIELLDELPKSEERFEMARRALEQDYRTTRIGFREVIGAARNWERHDLEADPREGWFKEIRESNLGEVLSFHSKHLKNESKLISIVGNKARIDMDQLEKVAPVKAIELEEIFVE